MTIDEAQREVRAEFLGGSAGQVVTGLIWLMSAALGTWAGQQQGILALFLGGMLIFPLTQLALWLLGRRGALGRGNPLGRLPLQSVAAMAAMYPLIYVATLYDRNWFYPAFMLVVGAHYISFIHLYGMWQYGVLAGALIAGGCAVRFLLPASFAAGGWLTGAVLLGFGLAIAVAAPWKARQPAGA